MVHEVKWDGIRILVEDGSSGPRLFSRNGNDVTVAWPDIAGSASSRDLVLDGEIIAMNDRGLPDFRVLQDRMHVRDPKKIERLARSAPAFYMAFDLLRLDGRELHHEPWEVRRELLESIDLQGWQVPPTYEDGDMLWAATREQGLEGVVSKRRRSPYAYGSGARTGSSCPTGTGCPTSSAAGARRRARPTAWPRCSWGS